MKRFVILIGIVFTLLILGCVPAMAISDESFSVGIGMGIPYGGGVIGGNFNISINDYIEFTVGAGLATYALGYDAGLRVYLISPENQFRFRASVFYGTNAVVIDLFNLDSTIYNGITAGLGGKYSFGESRRHAVAFDLMYIINSPEFEAAGYSLDNQRIKISGGYVFQM